MAGCYMEVIGKCPISSVVVCIVIKKKYIELSSSSISIILSKSRIAIGFPKIFFKIKCVVNNNTLLIRAFGSMDWLRQSVSYKGLVLSTILQLSSLPATLIPDGLVACQVPYVHRILSLLATYGSSYMDMG